MTADERAGPPTYSPGGKLADAAAMKVLDAVG